ncbi:MAG: putative porin [Firmicutes bacterium]|nr:putative porin [Bacillota bacterium]
MRSSKGKGCWVMVAVAVFSGVTAAQEQSGGGLAHQTPSPQELWAAVAELRELVLAQNRELAGQRELIRAQQQRLEQMEALLRQRAATATESNSPARSQPAGLPMPTGTALPTAQNQPGGAAAGLESLRRALGNFRFSGDLRLRGETFHDGDPARIRGRFRLRFNVDAQFGEEWRGGLRLASGDDTDPISTNQTFTDFFLRKPVNLDLAFVSYQPRWWKGLTLTGGKFAVTWHRTEMTLDNDLNPEGASQAIEFKVSRGALQRITLVGFQAPFFERSVGRDSLLLGGQVQLGFQPLGPVRLTTYAGFMDFLRTDPVRAAQTAVPQGLTGNVNNHAATATQFASRFGLLDLITRMEIDTGTERWPLVLQFDYVNNTRACTNLVNIAPPRPTCNPRDRDGFWVELLLGRTRQRHDVEFGYTFLRIEQEAVLGAFNFSDLRVSTGVFTHRLSFGYQFADRATLAWTGLFGRRLVTAQAPVREPLLRRMQFDVIYRY